MTRQMLITTGLILALGYPQGAGANNTLGLQFKSSFIGDPGFDAVSANDHLSQVEFSYARELMPLGPGELWVEADYTLGNKKSELFGGALSTKAFLHSVMLGGCYKLPMWTWLVPRARLGLGVLMGRLSATTEGAQEADDTAAAFTGHLLAGVELLWPRRVRRDGRTPTTAGLVIEAGYGFSSALGFELRPEEDDENLLIPLSPSTSGTLALNGFQLRIGVLVRF